MAGSSKWLLRFVAIELGTSGLYLAGMALIEFLIMPLFGPGGPPLTVWFTFLVIELVLLAGLCVRLAKAVDWFLYSVMHTWAVRTARSWLRERRVQRLATRTPPAPPAGPANKGGSQP